MDSILELRPTDGSATAIAAALERAEAAAAAQRYPDAVAIADYPRPTEARAADWFPAAADALKATVTHAELQKI